ncbi:ubiquinol-cytochrome C chaperone family protein [Maricaulaceae bacterium MS644]
MFTRLFKKDPMKARASEVYDTLVRAARKPGLYGQAGAPDTVDGRFDMITAHAILLFRRLRGQGDAATDLSQLVFDRMFDDFDAALREMGTGDLSVGKKIREMGEAFYGRAKAYEDALNAGDEEKLAAILERNLFAVDAEAEGVHEDVETIEMTVSPASRKLASYLYASARALDHQGVDAILAGQAPRFAASV